MRCVLDRDVIVQSVQTIIIVVEIRIAFHFLSKAVSCIVL